MKSLPGFALCAWILLASGAVRAQQTPPTLLEYPEGPVVNSNRVMGMGGAYVGVAEGADGHLYNPASFAYRYPFTRNDFFDWDWTLYWNNVPGKRNPDLYDGKSETTSTSWFGGGIDMKLARFGVGVHVYSQGYDLDLGEGKRVVTNTSAGLGVAYAFSKLDLTLGWFNYVFAWVVEDGDDPNEETSTLLSTYVGGSQVGLLWAPRHRPIRIGLVYRRALTATDVQARDPTVFETAPDGIYLPGKLSLGGSVMLWERRYNPNQTWGVRRLKEERPPSEGDDKRRYVLLSWDTVAKAAPPAGTVSMRSYLRNPDAAIPIVGRPTLELRLGVESEVLANWLRLRGGYYFEPARTARIAGRHHGTAGFDFRIPTGHVVGFWPWDLRLNTGLDVAFNYFNFGFGLGFWH